MDTLLYSKGLARFDASKGSFDQWQRICRSNAKRAEWRAQLKEWKRQAVTRSIDAADGGEKLLASSSGGGRDVDKIIDTVDTRLALDRAHGMLWAACVAIRCGFGLSQIADKLGIPRTTLRRALRNFGKAVGDVA